MTCGVVVFIEMNICIPKGKNFKIFLKENYAIALDSYYSYLPKKY